MERNASRNKEALRGRQVEKGGGVMIKNQMKTLVIATKHHGGGDNDLISPLTDTLLAKEDR